MTKKKATRRKRATKKDDYDPKLYEMSNRELYLRVELGFFLRDFESARDLKPKDRKTFERWLSFPPLAARLRHIVLRAFDGWEDRCNNNCKSMYFCSKKRGHRGQHETDGLVWD